MWKYNKLWRSVIFVMVLICLFIDNSSAKAAESSSGIHISDEAGCLLDIEQSWLEKVLGEYSSNEGVEICVVTVSEDLPKEVFEQKLQEKVKDFRNKSGKKRVYGLAVRKHRTGNVIYVPGGRGIEHVNFLREPVKTMLRLGDYRKAICVFAKRAAELERYYMENESPMPVVDLATQAANGDGLAQYFLAVNYNYGVTTERNRVLAVDFAKKSAEQGYADGQAFYARLLIENRDNSNGFEWAKKSADNGSSDGQAVLAELYFFGPDDWWDVNNGYKYAKMGAVQANTKAMGLMAFCNCVGAGTEKDANKAFWWAERAAARGDSWGQYILYRLYSVEQGFQKNDEKAMMYLKKAAENGFPLAVEELKEK